MANVLGWLRDLLTSDEERAAYQSDPEGYLRRTGFDDLTGEDVAEAIPALYPRLPDEVTARLLDDVAVPPIPAPLPGETVLHAAMRQLDFVLGVTATPDGGGAPDSAAGPGDGAGVAEEVGEAAEVADQQPDEDDPVQLRLTEEVPAGAEPTGQETERDDAEPDGPATEHPVFAGQGTLPDLDVEDRDDDDPHADQGDQWTSS